MIGTMINDRYQLDERLARLGPIEIFEGVDQLAGQRVRIKRLDAPLDQDLDFIENWRAQLLSIQALDDEHLPQIYHFGRVPDGELFQVEEVPPGLTARRYSATHAPVGVVEGVALVAAMARAAGVAHREGIAHGALTTENIYVEESAGRRPEAFITGWELGETVLALHNGGEPVPDRLTRYLAPEQLTLPAAPATPATDVYALGAMLYELLTGSRPNVQSLAGQYKEPTPPRRFNPEIPTAVEREITRALSYDAAARHPNGFSFSQALTQALAAPEPQSAPPPPPPRERVEVRVERPTWLPVAAILGSLLLCGLLALLLWNQRNDNAAVVVNEAEAPNLVPDLEGPPYIRYNDAVQIAWNEGFAVAIANFVDAPDLPPGVVVSQCPPPGSLPDVVSECPSANVPASENTILVEVNDLPDPVVLRVVPDLYGQPEPEARTLLEAGNLRLGTRRTAYDQLIPAGRIIEQNPRRGLGVLPGTPVDIIVSAGPPPAGEMGLVAPTAQVQDVAPQPDEGVPVEEPAEEQLPATASPTPQEIYPGPIESVGEPTALPATSTSVTGEDAEPPDEEEVGDTVLLEDDFEEGNVTGWLVAESEGTSAGIRDGVFVAEVTEPGLFWKSQAGRLFSDFLYEAEVTLDPDSADEGGSAGLVFRVQDDAHYYFFEINGLGQYRLRARDEDEWVTLLDWDEVPDIRPAGSANNLEVLAEGERLTLFINGTQLAVLDTPPDVTFLNGDIGFGIESDLTPIEATFDNVLVTR